MKILSSMMLSMLLVGCAAPVMKVNLDGIEKSTAVKVTDLRPKEEKESKMFSLSITSDAYGSYRRGDELLDPNVVRILQHRVFEKYSDSGALPAVKIHHFVVYMNLKSELRRGVAGGVLGGVIGSAIASGTQKYGIDGLASLTTLKEFESFDEEYKRSLYTEEQNPDKVSVFQVYLDAEIDGKRTFVKTMTPTKLPEGKNPHVAAVETAIAFYLDQY